MKYIFIKGCKIVFISSIDIADTNSPAKLNTSRSSLYDFILYFIITNLRAIMYKHNMHPRNSSPIFPISFNIKCCSFSSVISLSNILMI